VIQFVQAIAGLLVVLAAIAAAAWAMRRLTQAGPARGSPLALRGALAVGPRERVVVVEVEGTWLVLGVAPGRVQALHVLPKGNVQELPAAAVPAAVPAFAALLSKLRR
jgi:flagellar protein FliO/FliZ